jgi:DNA-binding beta-propeller fold protein YncE
MTKDRIPTCFRRPRREARFLLALPVLALGAVSCTSPTLRGPRSISLFADGLGDPAGVAAGPSGRVFVTDSERGEVAVFDSAGRRLATFGAGMLATPLGIAVDADGSVIVGDSTKDQVFRFAKDGSLLASFGRSGKEEGEFIGAGPLDVGRSGDIYVTDIDNNRIQVFDREGGYRFTFGKAGHFGNSAPGELYFPGGLALGGAGRVFVADTHNFRVQVFTADGKPASIWGHMGTWIGEFDHVFGIAVDDRAGRVYVVDDRVKLEHGGRRVQVFSMNGDVLGWLAPPEGEPPLRHAFDIAVTSGGRLLVTERSGGRVRTLFLKDIQKQSAAAGPASRPLSRPLDGPPSRPTSRPSPKSTVGPGPKRRT